MLQEEGKRQEMSQRGQRGGQSQSKSKSSIGRIKKREKKQKEKEPQFNNSDVINLDSEEESDQTHQYSFGHQGTYSFQSYLSNIDVGLTQEMQRLRLASR